jgi:hypothetical protein
LTLRGVRASPLRHRAILSFAGDLARKTCAFWQKRTKDRQMTKVLKALRPSR